MGIEGSAPSHFDIAIVGSGIVGASIGFFAAPQARVLLLEAESVAGRHATGRSAALFTEAYGPPMVRALTRASRVFFDAPPPGFAAAPLLKARGTLFVGSEAQRGDVLALHQRLRSDGLDVGLLDGQAARARVPVLRPEACAVALHDAAAFDIDVDALLQGYLRGARANGATVVTGGAVCSLQRRADRWHIDTAAGQRYTAQNVVNAAGAWADEVAHLAGVAPIAIEPRRRTAFRFAAPEGLRSEAWPAVIAIDETWYFKPDAGLLLGSPANADLVPPHDVVAEEFDVALGIHAIESATTMTIRRPRSTWAGLRSFVADGEPVCGVAPDAPGFFWAAALGGYGIQASPAFGRLAAAQLRGAGPPEDLLAQGFQAARLAPARPV